jgi:hypothetical protein
MNTLKKVSIGLVCALALFGLAQHYPKALNLSGPNSPFLLAAQPAGNCQQNPGAPVIFTQGYAGNYTGVYACLDNGTTTTASGNFNWGEIYGRGSLESYTFTLTNAQVLTMYTTPVSLVPAQGAGTVIEPVSLWLENVNGGTAYTSGGVFELAYNNAGTLTVASTTAAATFLTTPTVTQEILLTPSVGSVAASNTLNQPLTVTNLTGVFATGTGYINGRLRYRIHANL